jgi:hypothetical protein
MRIKWREIEVSQKTIERFWKYVDKGGLDECWEWRGGKTNGRGRFFIDPLVGAIDADKASWLIHNGKLPLGLYCVHTCRNRSCVNPDHVSWKTEEQYRHYMRGVVIESIGGELSPEAKLSNEQARSIRIAASKGTTEAELSLKYGVSRNVIQRVTTGRGYKKAGGPIRKPFKVTPVVAGAIRHLHSTGNYRQIEIATAFGIHYSTVSRIINGKYPFRTACKGE